MHIAKSVLNNILKGFLIGVGALIPGVSGGTTAIIVGAFEDIMEATANFFKHIRKSLGLLIPIFAGAILSVPLTSNIINSCLEKYPIATNIVFLVLSCFSSALFIIKKLDFSITAKRVLSLIVGIILALTFTKFKNLAGMQLENYKWYILIVLGLPLSLALILPAISFSYMLYFFGLYEPFLLAIENFDIDFLCFLVFGVISGSFAFSKLFVKLSEKYTQEIYYFIFGFVLCSNMDILIRILNY